MPATVQALMLDMPLKLLSDFQQMELALNSVKAKEYLQSVLGHYRAACGKIEADYEATVLVPSNQPYLVFVNELIAHHYKLFAKVKCEILKTINDKAIKQLRIRHQKYDPVVYSYLFKQSYDMRQYLLFCWELRLDLNRLLDYHKSMALVDQYCCYPKQIPEIKQLIHAYLGGRQFATGLTPCCNQQKISKLPLLAQYAICEYPSFYQAEQLQLNQKSKHDKVM